MGRRPSHPRPGEHAAWALLPSLWLPGAHVSLALLPTFCPPGWEWRYDVVSQVWMVGWMQRCDLPLLHGEGEHFRPYWQVIEEHLHLIDHRVSFLLLEEICLRTHEHAEIYGGGYGEVPE